MKNYFKHSWFIVLCAIGMLSSCKRESVSTPATTSTSTTTANLSGTIAVSSLAATTSGSKDSLYLVNCFTLHAKKDSVAFAALPSAIGTYLTANYAGYTFVKAYKFTDSLKVTTGYAVVIKYNGLYVGLKFDAAGTFVKVLEQRAGTDLNGKGWHSGGVFCNRDGKGRDTIALTAIPTVVKTYFTTNYPTDTLLHASRTADSSYILISKNKVLYATVISAAGKLIKRTEITQHAGKNVAVTQANLPAAISTYLTATYPNYVFDKAFARTVNGVIQEYAVFITANSTNYVVGFNASGTFVKAITIR